MDNQVATTPSNLVSPILPEIKASPPVVQKKEIESNPVGRPTVITEQVVRNLEVAFQNGMSDTTACQHAEISRDTFYAHLKDSQEFSDRIVKAKNFLRLLAGKRLVSIIKDGQDRDAAGLVKFTLEKLEPEQFGDKGSVVINQQFGYRDPDWWTPPQDIIEAQEAEKNKAKEPPQPVVEQPTAPVEAKPA